MNEDKGKDCLDLENNSRCCFFKVANAFLLLGVFLQFVILCFYAPRVINGKSLGFDYMGVIVAVLGILVTALITWQIWQVVDTKNTIRQMQKQVDIEKRKREADYKKYSEQLSLFTFAANCVNDAIMMMTELHNVIHNKLSSPRNITGYNVAYSRFLASIRDAVKADVPESERLIDICLDNMFSCINSAENLKNQYENYAKFDAKLSAECETIYNLIRQEYSQGLNRRQFSALEELKKRREALL